MLISCFIFVSAASFAETPQGVDRASPMTSFATHKSSDAFVQCVLDASRSEFPASQVESRQTSKLISISRAPPAEVAAVVDVEDGGGGTRVVIIRTASRAQPQRDPAVKIARNCQ
jgi:hypothetical protein